MNVCAVKISWLDDLSAKDGWTVEMKGLWFCSKLNLTVFIHTLIRVYDSFVAFACSNWFFLHFLVIKKPLFMAAVFLCFARLSRLRNFLGVLSG